MIVTGHIIKLSIKFVSVLFIACPTYIVPSGHIFVKCRFDIWSGKNRVGEKFRSEGVEVKL